MNAILYFGVFGCFCFIGWWIYRGYKQRKVFFEDLMRFCDHLNVEIGFSKKTVSEIIGVYIGGYGAQFAQVAAEYKKMLDTSCDVTRQRLAEIMWDKLKPAESSAAVDFFYELGKHAAAEECEKIKNARGRFENFYTEAREVLKRDASIYFKICILLGIGAVILML